VVRRHRLALAVVTGGLALALPGGSPSIPRRWPLGEPPAPVWPSTGISILVGARGRTNFLRFEHRSASRRVQRVLLGELGSILSRAELKTSIHTTVFTFIVSNLIDRLGYILNCSLMAATCEASFVIYTSI
jgi:hypothetical protein